MKIINEKIFEDIVCNELIKIGYKQKNEINRIGKQEFLDWSILKKQIIKINKTSEHNADKVIFELKKISNSAIESNIIGFNFLKNGIRVYDVLQKRRITLKLFSNFIHENEWFFIRQFEITSDNIKRIPDVVIFLNGIPISILELKSPSVNEGIEDAYKQNNSLMRICPQLFTFNIFNFISNHMSSKYGSITSSFKKYFNVGKWNSQTNPIKFIFKKSFIIKVIIQYSFFDNSKNTKYLAAPHQIQAVEESINKLINTNDNKGGVVWHTQGSGKSITMLILTKTILNKFPKSTIIVITDRNSLDKQLFERFKQTSEYLLGIPKEVESREDLIRKLNNKKHFGIFFTTIQKFSTKIGALSNRDDIFILVDEAHRTQNNIDGEKILSKENQEFIMRFGYARYMRDAFPNAKLTGFTGTPLMGLDKDTTNIFGGYNHIYSMNDSVKNGSTVPILYESRRINIDLEKKFLREMDDIQDTYAKTLDPNDIQSQQKIDILLKSVKIKKILEDDDVIRAKTIDILKHLKIRSKVLHGKAMIVVSSRKAAYKYYKEIIKQDPSKKDSTILVITSNNKDDLFMEKAIVSKFNMDNVAVEFRKSNSKYKIAIVVDMWLTGFDVPDLDVMYIDKVIKWHNLMQAIARVNRIYEDDENVKESGLIVDYLGIWNYLSDALIQYSSGTKKIMDMAPEDIKSAKIKLLDFIDIINSNYINGIKNFNNFNSKEQYTFVMDSLEKILGFDVFEKNNFIKLARKIKRLLKITFTIISKEISSIAKAIEVVNSLISTSNTQEDEFLKKTIDQINKAIAKAVDSKVVNVVVKTTQINKDINQVAQLLEEEAMQLKNRNPLIAKKLLEDAINSKISFLKKIRPFFAKKVSIKLQEILHKLEKEEKLNKIIDMLISLSKEITIKMDEKAEYSDPQMQAFYTILADDKYLKRNKSSEVLRKIAEDLMEQAKDKAKNGIRNPISRDKLEFALRKILKTKYDYPPKKLGGISGILINKIKETIDFFPEYFVGKKEI